MFIVEHLPFFVFRKIQWIRNKKMEQWLKNKKIRERLYKEHRPNDLFRPGKAKAQAIYHLE